MQWLAWWHSKGNEPVHINRHGLFTLILTQELSRNGKELAGNVLETGKKLICTVADQSWQHIFLGAESLHRFERSLDELLQKKSPQHHYGGTFTGEVSAGKPHHSSAFPWVPTSALTRGQLLLHPHLLLGVISTSSLPLLGNPEVKARDQRSCWRVGATWRAQMSTASTKPLSTNGSKIKDKIYTQQIYTTWS